jgi:hypothetical protein
MGVESVSVSLDSDVEVGSTGNIYRSPVLPTESAAYQTAAYQDEGVGSELEQLVEALPFAESLEDFASIVEGSPLEAVEDAIALQPDQPRRRQLREWLETLGESTFMTHLPQNEAEPVRVGQRVWAWIGAFRKWGQGVVSSVLPGVSWDVALEGEALDLVKIYQRSEIEPQEMSG